MADFLTTNGTSSEIENIIIDAKKELTLVSPYLKLSKTFYERLRDADQRGVKIRIVFGKDELRPNERQSLDKIEGAYLFYLENLHAKCYFNEETMVISSMNMYEFSERNNREMGVLIKRTRDRDLYKKAVGEVDSIIRSSVTIKESQRPEQIVESKKATPEPSNSGRVTSEGGYCIRCQKSIAYDPSKPYCYSCYTSWANFENPNYEEAVCHSCGKYEETTMNRPECLPCWKKNKNAVFM